VTQSKTSLEQALKLTKKLKKESASLREFVTSIDKELSKREMPTAAKDIEDELVWAKVRNFHCFSSLAVSFFCLNFILHSCRKQVRFYLIAFD